MRTIFGGLLLALITLSPTVARADVAPCGRCSMGQRTLPSRGAILGTSMLALGIGTLVLRARRRR
jgi:hypothetical protein